MIRQVASSHHWETPAARRPPWAPVDCDPHWLSLADWITDRMRLAIQAAGAHDGTDAGGARAARRALRRLFRDLGSEIVARGLAVVVRSRLDAYGLRLPARIWFAGRCDPSPDLMAHLLWTVQATADAVGAAIDLHARARIDESSDHFIAPEAWR